MTDLELFEGKKFSDLMKDIYNNSSEKHEQLNVLLNELRPMVSSMEQATMLYPIIKDMLDIGIRNDELLIKLANVFQKHVSVDKKLTTSTNDGLLTEEDKENILKDLDMDLLKKEQFPKSDDVTAKKIKKIKNEIADIIGESDDE